MKKFLLRMSFFMLLFLSVTACSLGIYMRVNKLTWKDFPGPEVSDSYSFNEKMHFLKNKNIQADVISIGSSMTLNNINSISIVHNLETESYINAASWGMTMKDNFTLLKLLCSAHFPKVLVINSCLADFQQSDKNIDCEILKKYLLSDKDKFTFLPYIIKPGVEYYLKHLKYGKKLRYCLNDYEYLGFDEYGGVNFNSDHFNIKTERWIKNTIGNKIIPAQYIYLDSIASFCEQNNIKLLFFQSPLREGLYSKLSNNEHEKFLSHIRKEDTILTLHHQVFVNAAVMLWKDDLFVDGTHLKENGAKVFTDYCFTQIRNLAEIKRTLKTTSYSNSYHTDTNYVMQAHSEYHKAVLKN